MTDEQRTNVWAHQIRADAERREKIQVFGNYGYGSGGNLFSVSFPDNLKFRSPNGMSEDDIAKKYPIVLFDPREEERRIRAVFEGVENEYPEGPPMSTPPARRNRIDQFTPAEKAIYDAVQAVEAAGCDVRLTQATNVLYDARMLVADFVDGVPETPPKSIDWIERTKLAREKAGWAAWDHATEVLDAAAGDMPQPWRNAAIALLAEHHPAVIIANVLTTLQCVQTSIPDSAPNHQAMMERAIETLQKLPHVPEKEPWITSERMAQIAKQTAAEEEAPPVGRGPAPRSTDLGLDDGVRHKSDHIHYLRGNGIIRHVFEEECAVAWSSPGAGITITRKTDLQRL